MRKNYLLLVVCIFTFFSLASCKGRDFDKNFECGVIETRGDKNKTIITFYNEDNHIVNIKKLDYGDSSDYFQNAKIDNDNLIMIPRGLFKKKDLGKLINLNLNSGEIIEYKTGILAPVSFSFDSNNYYVSNTFNGVSTLTQISKDKQKTNTLNLKDEFIESINNYEKNDESKVILFTATINNDLYNKSYMYILSNNLEIEEKIDTTEYGFSRHKSIVIDSSIYFLNSTDKFDNFNNIIGIYNFQSKDFSKIVTKENKLGDVAYYKNNLYVTHTDLVDGSGSKVSIIDIKNGSIKEISTESPSIQIEIKNDILYIFSGETISKYLLSLNKVEKLEEVNIRSQTEEQFYPSSFFVN
ncbi:hypothetical protein [Miniphocaeibacter halophilus]|uniref:Uncharacterized protein n=1 Tax=Miniphocaeibacter halophilus TaxID=2931922 RepID=A0AC61MTD0_9FIRM|nr:hypothetical protein [Miniphocaeibacter halophilus]QQK08960.1 hypothetical protein JFY71_05330 [Miniphocaeibacter halophilus]